MNSFRMHSVLIVGTELDAARKVEKTIRATSKYQTVTVDAGAISGDIGHVPDVAVVDVAQITDAELNVLNELRGQFGDLPIIVISEALDDEQMRRLFKLKVSDWLRKPLSEEALSTALRSALRTAKSTGNRVHAIISAVGGAGATTIAISMADYLADKFKKDGETVALFDLDFSTGNCSYLLNMVNSYNLESVAAHPERVDAEFVGFIQQKHPKGFYVYSFKRPEINGEINGYELVLRMLDTVNMQHEHTILDIPYYETEWKSEVLSAVNTCTVVTEMNLPAIKHAIDVVDRIKEQRGDDYPVRVVFNKSRSHLFGQRIKKSTLEDLFEKTPFFYLSEDENTIDESVDRGLLPSEVRSSSKFLKSLRTYLKGIELTNA
ncbi:MAG: hypothetical protein KJO78_02905 [Alphaproteobacteria bacterium]|nr:hypothetical protein [Alphaproteobacteria bacterium]